MPTYAVHIYAIVRVKVNYIKAADPAEAARRADGAVNLYQCQNAKVDGAAEIEWAEDVQDYLVDELLDETVKAEHAVDKHYYPRDKFI